MFSTEFCVNLSILDTCVIKGTPNRTLMCLFQITWKLEFQGPSGSQPPTPPPHHHHFNHQHVEHKMVRKRLPPLRKNVCPLPCAKMCAPCVKMCVPHLYWINVCLPRPPTVQENCLSPKEKQSITHSLTWLFIYIQIVIIR